MALEQPALQAGYAAAVLTSILLLAVLWQYRDRPGGWSLLVYVGAGLYWSAILLANVTVTDPALSAVLYRALYVGIAIGAAALVVFALEYTGRERFLGPATYLALSVHPVTVAVFAIADPGNHFFGTIEPDPASSIAVAPDHGVALVGHLAYSYALLLAVGAMFAGVALRSRSIYRRQAAMLVLATLTPGVTSLALTVGLVDVDVTPLVLPVVSLLFAVAIIRYQLIDLLPIASDRVLETVQDGVFVLDDAGRLIDVNDAGRFTLSVLGVESTSLIGRPFADLVGETALYHHVESLTTGSGGTTIDVEETETRLEVTTRPIEDDYGRHVGWVLITHDVTDVSRRERQLRRQNDRLEQFASLVSHDLRNPLNVARGSLGLVEQTGEEEYYEKIERHHGRMEAIIEDILTLAREGKAVTGTERVDLGALARRAWEGVDTGSATLEIDSSATIQADPDRLLRVLENLFRNAIEHGVPDEDDRASEELTVTVGVEAGGSGHVTFVVEDDGVGVPPENREQVFEHGYSTGRDGTGLGLSIVRQIADAHGWTVEVTESASGGARFEFSGVERDASETDLPDNEAP
ncbi:histidine kinase N-terminal 7TM domain-containing protein [Natrarchaeobaculum aegyptiacum]|uniref:histidine kinase n=1 Tax=Natrarchaeobaculum aegyptiacum TaxID=745377 RepID=A0A2Z2HUI5_9EURY|nr:histidine kinase N-terminal 7TM domain-containing protein [Natrarchaeobaculum aegyptiacum]ARS90842.1 hypothetical protein B1756_14660 [Natrarchaeobaculum aegyptiacum]